MRRDVKALLVAVMAGVLLGGCGFVHRHFGRDGNRYKRSVEEQPLEVPPDLDRPNTTGALTVPQPGAASTATTTAAPAAVPATGNAPPASNMEAAPAMAPAAGGVTLSGSGLAVADTPDSTWHRVGLAIERSGAGTIVSSDASGRTYEVETTGQTTEKAGWFKRMITLGRAKNKVTARVRLTVRVAASGNGSEVSIEGANDEASQEAARALLATLKQRLS